MFDNNTNETKNFASIAAELFENKTNLKKKSVSDAFSDDEEDYPEEYRKVMEGRVDDNG